MDFIISTVIFKCLSGKWTAALRRCSSLWFHFAILYFFSNTPSVNNPVLQSLTKCIDELSLNACVYWFKLLNKAKNYYCFKNHVTNAAVAYWHFPDYYENLELISNRKQYQNLPLCKTIPVTHSCDSCWPCYSIFVSIFESLNRVQIAWHVRRLEFFFYKHQHLEI